MKQGRRGGRNGLKVTGRGQALAKRKGLVPLSEGRKKKGRCSVQPRGTAGGRNDL